MKGRYITPLPSRRVGPSVARSQPLTSYPVSSPQKVITITPVLRTVSPVLEHMSQAAQTRLRPEHTTNVLREECKPAIPVSHISIGTIYKKDVTRASIMHDKGQPEFATILAFDVKIDAEALTLADEVKVSS